MVADSQAVDPLAAARRALERGEYGVVLRQLEPLAQQHPPATPLGAQLQLLMATAWMGQGQGDRAIACCQAIRACGNAQLRVQARELLAVLEAPVLRRPREWSLTLPALSEAPPLEGRRQAAVARRRASARQEEPPPPPVGPTRPPLGFAVVVLTLLLALAFLLGGCVQVRAELQFHGPGRLQIGFAQQGSAAVPGPWQRRFSADLRRQGLTPSGDGLASHWRSPVLPADAALQLLGRNLEAAARLGGMELPPPQLQLRERNWLVGVQQRLTLQLDLRALEPMEGLDLGVELWPVRQAAVRSALPQAVRPAAGPRPASLLWPLQAGADNRLDLRCWRWNPLGLGGLLITLALGLVSLLTRLRRLLGFGLPELPAGPTE